MSELKFLKKGIKYEGKYIPVWYSKGVLIGYPEGTITIYAREYSGKLPKELNPENDSDPMTDYFTKDTARITPDNQYYDKIKSFVK